jgi:hypothetical protein
VWSLRDSVVSTIDACKPPGALSFYPAQTSKNASGQGLIRMVRSGMVPPAGNGPDAAFVAMGHSASTGKWYEPHASLMKLSWGFSLTALCLTTYAATVVA